MSHNEDRWWRKLFGGNPGVNHQPGKPAEPAETDEQLRARAIAKLRGLAEDEAQRAYDAVKAQLAAEQRAKVPPPGAPVVKPNDTARHVKAKLLHELTQGASPMRSAWLGTRSYVGNANEPLGHAVTPSAQGVAIRTGLTVAEATALMLRLDYLLSGTKLSGAQEEIVGRIALAIGSGQTSMEEAMRTLDRLQHAMGAVHIADILAAEEKLVPAAELAAAHDEFEAAASALEQDD